MPAARARPSSSPLSSWPCPCRTSTWSSFRFSIDARQQRVAQGVAAVLVQCGVVGFADAEHVLGALRSEEHTSELQSLMRISYAVFCLKKKKQYTKETVKYSIDD